MSMHDTKHQWCQHNIGRIYETLEGFIIRYLYFSHSNSSLALRSPQTYSIEIFLYLKYHPFSFAIYIYLPLESTIRKNRQFFWNRDVHIELGLVQEIAKLFDIYTIFCQNLFDPRVQTINNQKLIKRLIVYRFEL